jgi:carboxyl-terminal processing protease
MENLVCPSVAERIYGLSLIWQEANYNFAFFDRVPDLDWDAAYREFIPKVIAAEDIFSYYNLHERFIALLNDGHTWVLMHKDLTQQLDQPKLSLMNINGSPIVTNVSQAIGHSVPIGSQLLEINGIAAEEYLLTYVLPVVGETTPHCRRDRATARLLLVREKH